MAEELQKDLLAVEQRLGVEENGINVIPESERKGTPSDLFWPWAAANISVFGISMAAFIFGFGISFWQALVAAFIGITFSFFLVGLVSLAGKHASAPTMVISRASFGIKGNAFPTLVSYLLLVGWEIVLVALGTLATATVFDRLGWASGNGVKVVAFIVIAGIVVYAGVVGFDFLMRLQTWITGISIALTVMYIAFTLDEVNWGNLADAPSGPWQAFLGAVIFAMTGFGIGWVNCGADYSRYLPRASSGRAIVGWTTFGASISPLILITYGLLLVASNPDLVGLIGADPIGALTRLLPTSALILLLFLVVVTLGFIGGAVLDIYSSGLALLTLGLRVPRAVAAGLDGVLMILGTIYVVWIADTFFGPFQGFLYLLGVPMAAWAGIFVADMVLRKEDIAQDDLYSSSGRYGAIGWPAFLTMVVATLVGWGMVVSFFDEPWLTWQGYILSWLDVTDTSPWYYANIGILASLAIGFFGQLLFGGPRVRRTESSRR